MTIQRLSLISLVAFLALSFQELLGSDFAERMASWQSGGTVIERPSPPADTTAQPAPRPAPSRQQIITENYDGTPPGRAIVDHGGQYGGCQSCGYGNSPYMGGACVCGSYGGNACCWPPLFPHLFGGGACHCGNDCGPCGDCCNTLVWAKFDVLLWWRQGRDLPPLVTTDPTTESSTTAGVLPEAHILFGGDRVGTDLQAGGRFDVGVWCDPRQCWGYGWRFFGLGKDSSEFHRNSFDTPVLAIPFFDADAAANDQLLVAFPGLRSGDVHVTMSGDVISNDIYGRFLLCRGCDGGRLDFITGWNYTRLADSVTLRTRSTVTEIGGTIPNGTVTTTFDSFEARNTFNGAILGLMWERDCGCWTTNLMGRMSIGGIHQAVTIDGSAVIAVPTQPEQTSVGGVLTGDSNIGTFTRSEFTAITEVGANFAYRWGPCTRLNFGYTLLYWSDIQSPGTAIDTTVADEGRPSFTPRHSDYWVQGLNLGLVREF